LTVVEDVDRQILAFAAAHRFVLDTQIGKLLGAERGVIAERVVGLKQERWLREERVQARRPGLIRITGAGLRAIGSRMPAPGFDLTGYRHEVGVVSMWVAAWQGALGEAERVLSRREMEALDVAGRAAGEGDRMFALRIGAGARGRTAAAAYPDLMLVYGWGRVAVQLVTWPHRFVNLDDLFAAHQSRPEVADLLLVFVDDRRVGGEVERAAERQGVAEKLRVQRVVARDAGLPQTARG
jgi:hypothetical protein